MKTQLQLIATTIALTVLIWVYADQSDYEFYQTTVLVRYVPTAEPENPFVVRVRGGRAEAKDAARIEVTFRGPKSAIRRLEKDDASGRFTLSVLLSDELKRGLQPARDVQEDLGRLGEIRNRGVSLQHVYPRTVQLEVDRYCNVPVQVEVTAGSFEKALRGAVSVQPDTVTARVLESQVPESRKLPPLKLSIEDLLQSRAEQAGGLFSFDVPLKSTWPKVEATFTPEQVHVVAQLGRPTTSERVTLIPLRVLVEPQNFFGKYDIEWQDQTGAQFTQTITVRIPLSKAGQLKGSMIDAYISIDDSDLPKGLPGVTSAPATQESWIEREVRFVFQPDFQDARIEGPTKTIKFRIRKLSEISPGKSSGNLPIVPALNP